MQYLSSLENVKIDLKGSESCAGWSRLGQSENGIENAFFVPRLVLLTLGQYKSFLERLNVTQRKTCKVLCSYLRKRFFKDRHYDAG